MSLVKGSIQKFYAKICLIDAHWNCLSEIILVSTNRVHFDVNIKNENKNKTKQNKKKHRELNLFMPCIPLKGYGANSVDLDQMP